MPLAEQWREEASQLESCNTPAVLERAPKSADAHVNMARARRYCADRLEQFAAEHLTEQTEPSAELRQLAIDAGYNENVLPHLLVSLINAERRRIRELLVGKETK